MAFPYPSTDNGYLAEHVLLLRHSLQRVAGRDLLENLGKLSDTEAARVVFHSPVIVVSHDTAPSPIFTYGNQAALNLFEMSWEEFTTLPSAQSAEPPNRAERAQLLEAVTRQGYVDNYCGVRIAKSGRRFIINGVTVWNLSDANGTYCGQAAVYSQWQNL